MSGEHEEHLKRILASIQLLVTEAEDICSMENVPEVRRAAGKVKRELRAVEDALKTPRNDKT